MADDKSTSSEKCKLLGDAFSRMNSALRDAAEAAIRFAEGIDRAIEKSLAGLTPTQLAYYRSRVDSGAPKLNALDDAKRFVD